jgi:hypothetical protein
MDVGLMGLRLTAATPKPTSERATSSSGRRDDASTTALRAAQAQRLAALFRTDVSPARGTKTNGLTFYGLRSESFQTRDVEHLQRKIEQHLWRKACLSHDTS